MTTLITGATSGLGRRVGTLLGGQAVPLVVAVDGDPDAAGTVAPEPADVLVHLAAGDHDSLARRAASPVALSRAALRSADDAGVQHVVLLSSAMVYGAWPNNPTPLTEDAPLRPDVGFAFASQLALVEEMADEWRRSAPGRSVSVLRPALALAADGTTSVVRALADSLGTRLGEDDPPAQFLHLDDLASAVVLAHDRRLDGVYNVAADGWVLGERVRALAGVRPRLRLPERLAEPAADLRWRFRRGPIPPGLRPYARHPWLVANDRLRSAGWVPTVTNEQAYVEGTEAKWWTMLTPKRKQEIALAAMVLGALAIVVGVVDAVRRIRRRRN